MKYPFSGIIVRYVREPEKSSSQTGDAPIPDPADELHINLWEVSGRRLLDIGVMIDKPEIIKSIQIDLPWVLDKSKVFDLGSRLVGEKIVAAIFNEVVHYCGSNDDYFANISIPPDYDPEKAFILVRLNSNNFDLATVRLSEGGTTTKLTVSLPKITPADEKQARRRYLRFRIIDIPEEIYAAKFSQKDRNLLSSSVETRIVDFRINVRRGVPDDILTSGADLFFPRWKKIHLFLTVDRAREMTFKSENFVACRSLEDEEIWNSYIALDSRGNGHPHSVSNYLGYQWTVKMDKAAKTPAKDLVALARFSEVISSKWGIVRFILLALFVGASGSGTWDTLKMFLVAIADKPEKSEFFTILIIISAAIAIIALATPAFVIRTKEKISRTGKKILVGIGKLFKE
jgi:hypothetical protein